jgi:hypothetical protein
MCLGILSGITTVCPLDVLQFLCCQDFSAGCLSYSSPLFHIVGLYRSASNLLWSDATVPVEFRHEVYTSQTALHTRFDSHTGIFVSVIYINAGFIRV